MDAGKLNRRVTIEAPGTAQDSVGQLVQTWSTVAEVWAAIRPLAGRELMLAKSVEAEITHTVTIRYRSGITTGHRLLFGARVFNITAVIDRAEAGRYLELSCTEGLNNG